MSLWKRGNVWWAYFYVDGVRNQASTGTSNRRQAELVLRKLKDEANANRHRLVELDPTITFEALAARFIASGSARPHHVDRLKLLLPYFADLQVLRINKSILADYRRKRQAEKPLSDATVNRDLSVLRNILYWAVDEALLAANPVARMRLARERRTKRQVLSCAEEDKLLPAASEHLYRIIMAALDTGMRRGEITNQRWEDIDFDRRILSVTRSTKAPEGEAREIPLSTRLYDLLAANREERGLIFTFRGKQVRILKRAWQATLRRAGLRHIRFHDLRHTFNTRLMEAGVMQEVRMALMGHSSGQKVHSIYTHVELPVKRDAIARLERWVEQQKSQFKGGHSANSETA
jgi:integrase